MWWGKEKKLNHVQINCKTIKKKLSFFKSKKQVCSSSERSEAGLPRRAVFKEKL